MTSRIKSTVLFSPNATLVSRAQGEPKKKKKSRTAHSKRRSNGAAHRKYAVGVVDLDVHAGYLSAVFDSMNHAQKTFVFQTVIMPIRAGLAMSGARTEKIIKNFGGEVPQGKLAKHVYAPDLFKLINPLTKLMKFDTVGLLVSRMIVEGKSKKTLEWNLFSTGKGRKFIASAYRLADYATRAKHPFEACLAMIVVAQAFSALFPRVDFHEETRGCLFDYCDRKGDIIKGLTAMAFCEESLTQFPPAVRRDALKVVVALRKYERAETRVAADGSRKLRGIWTRKPKPKHAKKG